MSNIKLAVLGYRTRNIGDEVQTIAAISLLPKVDYIIDRDNYDIVYAYDTGRRVQLTEHVILIMNGFLMQNPNGITQSNPKFPILNPKIHPFFISTYLDPAANLIQSQHLQYYRENQPFLSRSLSTMNTLREKGVECDYYGCLTQTLDITTINPSNQKNNKIIFVDCVNIDQIMKDHNIPKTQPITNITHVSRIFATFNQKQRLDYARKLLLAYSGAKKIFTTRLHCFLPCRAMGLDVIYLGSLDGRTRDLVENIPNKDDLKETFYRELENKINEVRQKYLQ